MNKRKIVFLSSMAFDANISLIRRLKDKYEVYYLGMYNDGKNSFGDVHLRFGINSVNEFPAFCRFSDFLDLKKSYLVRHPNGFTIEKIAVEIKVDALVSQICPDVILTDVALFGMWLTRIKNKKKVISLIHDPLPHSGADKRFSSKITRNLLAYCSEKCILFNCEQKSDFIQFYNLPEQKIFTSFLSQYEFLTCFKNNKFHYRQDNSLNILFFGRIEPYKGIRYLVEAVRRIIDSKRLNVRLIVAGKGSYDFNVDTYKDYKEIEFYNEFISTERLYCMVNDCDVVVCPYTDATQSGVIMSAYALLKPVIATNVGGLPEMLNNGETGMLIEPKRIDALMNAIITFGSKKELAEKYSESIKKYYFNDGEKSWDEAVKKIEEAMIG